jgi:hypothetical protein
VVAEEEVAEVAEVAVEAEVAVVAALAPVGEAVAVEVVGEALLRLPEQPLLRLLVEELRSLGRARLR